jgi:hypothetical protein
MGLQGIPPTTLSIHSSSTRLQVGDPAKKIYQKGCLKGMHTFVVRFWLEPSEIKESLPEWRGVIEHITSCQHRYIRDLDEISAFISPFLKSNNQADFHFTRRCQD